MALSAEALVQEQRRLFVAAGGGASLPAAGALYWLALGVTGFFTTPDRWTLTAAVGSAMIFPLGMALQRPFRSNIIGRLSPLVKVAPMAVLGINLLWPLYIILMVSGQHELVPLALALGMAVHWPVLAWLYRSRVCLAHALVRTVAATSLWALLPGQRFTVLPLAIAAIYVVTVVGLKIEVAATRRLDLPAQTLEHVT